MSFIEFQTLAGLLILSILVQSSSQFHGFPRGYRNGRSWGTGPQRSGRYSARQARQFMEKMSECAVGCDETGGKVCGSDGKTYGSECELRRAGCSRVRRQGRSFESGMLKIEVSYPGACREPCAGMDSLGQFQAFGSPATNYGLCVHDFFRCATVLRGRGMAHSGAQACCQTRFDKCFRI